MYFICTEHDLASPIMYPILSCCSGYALGTRCSAKKKDNVGLRLYMLDRNLHDFLGKTRQVFYESSIATDRAADCCHVTNNRDRLSEQRQECIGT